LPIIARLLVSIGDENARCAPASYYGKEQRMQKRRRLKQTQPLEERLAHEAKRLREQAQMLPHGRLRDAVERKAIQIEAAYEVSELLRSPGLRAPDSPTR
jgi:hypothetical protein